MKRIVVMLCLAISMKAVGQTPRVFVMNANRLVSVKKKVVQKDKSALALVDSLRKQADALLATKPMSVMDKEFMPVSGNKHDYMSQAPYFWYDSTKPNGLPYMRKDGVRNPEIYKITDRTYLGRLENASRVLSLAWYFTGEEKYAAKAAILLRTWFLDDATKMNPNLDYGQAVPGINNGRGIGIIETVALTGIADAAGLLTGSTSWTSTDHKALQQWYTKYLTWLLTSKNGNEEHAAKNNHGTWYYAQAIDFALFTGNNVKAKQLAEESKKRLDGQLTPEGKQPLELERTNGLGYSTMNLRGWFTVASLANKTGVNIWNYQTTQAAGLRTAFDWLLPYAIGEKQWPAQQISNYNKSEFYPLLLQAAVAFNDPKYEATAKQMEKNDVITELLYGKSTSAIAEVVAYNPTHIGRITNDSIIVATGSTYSFTVDTPEDKGLISTNTTVQQLLAEINAKSGVDQKYQVVNKEGAPKEGDLASGDHLVITSKNSHTKKSYFISVQPMALGGQLLLERNTLTVNATSQLVLYFTAGQRTPNTTVNIYIPAGIEVTGDNTTVNVIGRGDVKLNDLATQSIGRIGTNYPYHKVGNFAVSKKADGSSVLLFKHLDLRPANGADLKIVIGNVTITKAGRYIFRVTYTTSKPEVLTSPGIGAETATLTVTNTISDLERVITKDLQYKESGDTYTTTSFKWGAIKNGTAIQLMESLDKGKTWTRSSATIDPVNARATVSGLAANRLYSFRLSVKEGAYKGFSNTVYFYSGKMDIKSFGITGDSIADRTEKINAAIEYLNGIGGGTLLFSEGIYNVRTIHLKSNVYLYIAKGAVIKAIKGADAPEATWFSDKQYRSGLSPTDDGPYTDPENYMTKQDVGHHYFRNTMFFGERLDNVKIIGNGLITGNGNLVNGDNVMKNAPDNRADKMFTLKLCTNLEIGGIYRSADLWYDSTRDEPYYIRKDGSKDFDTDNMLQIDRTGHFALLATGTDNINVHDTYFAKDQSSARDVYDFMECNNVTATNIYSRVSSDDIIKPGSDCSLGFTRPASNYKVRNIIGDTNCNLFQIGSETADDIMDVHVDNIYVLGANKAGFSISTNDGAHIKDVHLNCGHTGPIHSRSKMYRTFTPFFISISNRGRILGASVSRYKFDENGVKHDELLVTNVNIGLVENIIINGIDIAEVYGGSSYGGKNTRWKAYDGTQRRATPIIAGYKLPDPEVVEGGLNFKLPNGNHTGYIKNIVFNDVQVLVKGGNPASDTAAAPPELGVGQYNASNLKTEPSYGLWARHVMGLTVTNSSFNYEQPDGRYAIFLDDVVGARISNVKMVQAADRMAVIKMINSPGVVIEK